MNPESDTSADGSPLAMVERLLQTRRAVRHFQTGPLPDGLLERLLDAARWAPSGYNLQPTHFVIVDDPELKPTLRAACMDQAQITEAPVTVVFAGDRLVGRHHFPRTLAMDKQLGVVDARYEALLRKYVPLAFETRPLGLGWLWKAMLPLARWFTPIPSMPAVHRRYWLAKQVGLSAMAFMLAATAAGLATCPMEGFDERRVRRLLQLPRSVEPVLVVPVGCPAPGYEPQPNGKSRLPLDDLLHRNRW